MGDGPSGLRTTLGPFTGGLDTQSLPLAGPMNRLQDLRDVRMNRGAIEGRTGFRVLNRERSNFTGSTEKAQTFLTFSAAATQYGEANINSEWRLGRQWTIRMECVFAVAANAAAGDHTILWISRSGGDAVLLVAEGDGTDIRLKLSVTDKNAAIVTFQTAYKSIASWTAGASSRFIRITRSSQVVNLYVGEVLEATTSSFTSAEHNAALLVRVARGSVIYGGCQWQGLTICNRVLTEYESYFRIRFPTDPADVEDLQILGNWPMYEGQGALCRDFSYYNNVMVLTNTPTWTGSAHTLGRGLGVHTFRKKTGDTFWLLAASRNGLLAGGSTKAAIYAWRNTDQFFSFFLNGNPDADDTAPISIIGSDGYDILERIQFLTAGNICPMMNGVDNTVKFTGNLYNSSPTCLFGGTAPSTAIRAALAGGALTGTFKYWYSFYNRQDKHETGLSPVVSIVLAAQQATLTWYTSPDVQFDYVRIYRSTAGQDVPILLAEVAMAATGAFVDNFTDAVIQNNGSIDDRAKRPYLQGGPPAAPTLALGGAGLPNGNYRYAYSWYNPTTGVETGLSPESALVAPVLQIVNVTYGIPSDPSFSQVRIYRTTAAGFQWRHVADVTWANPPVVYADNVADGALGIDLRYHALPPKCRYAVMFGNRIWMAGDPSNPSAVYWSSAGDYENFPILNFHVPNGASEVTGLYATEGTLFISYRDGSVYVMPNPGAATQIDLLVLTTMRLFSPKGATIGHFTQVTTDIGPIWLGIDGLYLLTAEKPVRISEDSDLAFSTLNVRRGRYACAVFDERERLYRVWTCRGTERLNAECFVFHTKDRTVGIDQFHADVVGTLVDAQENKHYVLISELGIISELYPVNQDGGGAGTMDGTVAGASLVQFTNIVGRGPPSVDGGYPIWFIDQTTGDAHQRYVDPTSGPAAGVAFYPSLKALQNGNVWKVYFHGIRSRFRTMQTDLGQPRQAKTLKSLFFSFVAQLAGAMKLVLYRNCAVGGSTQASVNFVKPCVHEVAIASGDGRVFEFEATHEPPKADEPWAITTVEAAYDLAADTPG